MSRHILLFFFMKIIAKQFCFDEVKHDATFVEQLFLVGVPQYICKSHLSQRFEIVRFIFHKRGGLPFAEPTYNKHAAPKS